MEKLGPDYDRYEELKWFDDTKAGVKGLVDGGLKKIPHIFITPPDNLVKCDAGLGIPLIDLKGINANSATREPVVLEVLHASKTWGFFQVKVEYMSNFDLLQAPFTNWRDSIFAVMTPDLRNPEELPIACRHVTGLATKLLELISEALGLKLNHLKEIGCAEGLAFLGHYYPACPEPDLTLSGTKHAGNDFLTILLQYQISGLQVLHQNHWVDVPPVHGSLVINIGDLLQLVSNDRLKSSEHRILSNGPRISLASFFSNYLVETEKIYGPIKELLSVENPAMYKQITVNDFNVNYNAKGLSSALAHFKI